MDGRLPAIIISLLAILPANIHAVLFSTKAYAGSTCMHDLETASSMRFDRGEMGAFVARSVAVHVTNHGVRFVLPVHHVRQGGMHGWTSMDCVQSSDPRGSLCSIPILSSETQKEVQSYNEVLPCGTQTSEFVARTSKPGYISPDALNHFLSSIPDTIRSCKDVGGAVGPRVFVPPPEGSMYDMTQCDFHDCSISALYIPMESKIYFAYGLQLPGKSWMILCFSYHGV